MPSNLLLLLPLLGGYAFIHLCYFTRFRAQTLEGHRLIFEAAVWGFLLVAPARALTLFWLGEIPWIQSLWSRLGGSQTGYLGTLICALALAPVLALLWNYCVAAWLLSSAEEREEDVPGTFRDFLEPARLLALDRAILRSGDDLRILLHKAATRARRKVVTVCLSMADGKVYLGVVTRPPNLRPDEKSLSLLPVASGYRDKDDRRIHWNVRYPVDQYGKALDPDEFIVVLPLADIKNARLFDEQYGELFSPEAAPRP
jgi:hypothetical protein